MWVQSLGWENPLEIKNPPAVQETQEMWVQSLGWENPLEEEILQYSCLENHLDRETWRRKWQPTAVFLSGESQGRGSMVSCRLWGRRESDTTEVTKQQQLRNPAATFKRFKKFKRLQRVGFYRVTKHSTTPGAGALSETGLRHSRLQYRPAQNWA